MKMKVFRHANFRVFVSPFGLGEFSGKDYEAILSGTLLVR
jgi:hypothetical protein